MKFEQVAINEIDEVMKIYDSLRNDNLAGWNENYPDIEYIRRDIERKQMYCLKEDDRIIACIAYAKDGQFDEVSLITTQYKPTIELSRLAVSKDHQNKGIAKQMINTLLQMLKQEGYKSVHYLVSEGNTPALRSYAHLQFEYLGKVDMYDMRFLCYAKML